MSSALDRPRTKAMVQALKSYVGSVATREQLAQAAGMSLVYARKSRAVDVHVSRARVLLEAEGYSVLSAHKTGYHIQRTSLP